MSCLKFGKKQLRPHQIRVIKTLFDKFSILAAHGTGTGKTLTAVAASECLLYMKKVTHVIVATPRALVDNFWKELLMYKDTIDVEKYTVATYQGIEKKFKEHPTFFKNAFLIVDEAHNLRTEITECKGKMTGKMASNFIKMATKVNKVLLLTATPLVNRIEEFNNLYHILAGDGKIQGSRAFMSKLDLNTKNCPIDLQHYQVLIDVHKRTMTDANFPRVQKVDEIFTMTGDYLEEYKVLEKKINEERDFTFFTKLRQLMNKMGNAEVYKVAFVLDKLIHNHKHKVKTVIFSQFLTNGVHLTANYLSGRKIPYFLITGKTKKKDIQTAIIDFNKRKYGGILFISKAGGEGLDLKGVREMILMEPFWNENNETQAVGRAVRYLSHTHLPPSEREVKIFRLILKKPKGLFNRWVRRTSVDEYLVQMAKDKQVSIDQFLRCLS